MLRDRLSLKTYSARMVELVDTLDLKSNGHYCRAGSSPAPSTQSLQFFLQAFLVIGDFCAGSPDASGPLRVLKACNLLQAFFVIGNFHVGSSEVLDPFRVQVLFNQMIIRCFLFAIYSIFLLLKIFNLH